MASSYRSGVPQNTMRNMRAPPNHQAYNNNSSPAGGGMYHQQQTTMFLPAAQAPMPPYYPSTGTNIIVRPGGNLPTGYPPTGVPIGMTQPMPNQLGGGGQHFTINTSQPPQYTITQNFPVQMGYSLAPPNHISQQAQHQLQQPAQQQQTVLQPPPQQQQPVSYYPNMPTQMPRPQAPPSHQTQPYQQHTQVNMSSAPQSSYRTMAPIQTTGASAVSQSQPRKRQTLQIIDPKTNQEVDLGASQDASQSESIPTNKFNAEASSFFPSANAVHASGGLVSQQLAGQQPIQQIGTSQDSPHPSTDTGPVSRPAQSSQNGNQKAKPSTTIAAEFAAQVAAAAMESKKTEISTSTNVIQPSSHDVPSEAEELEASAQETVQFDVVESFDAPVDEFVVQLEQTALSSTTTEVQEEVSITQPEEEEVTPVEAQIPEDSPDSSPEYSSQEPVQEETVTPAEDLQPVDSSPESTTLEDISPSPETETVQLDEPADSLEKESTSTSNEEDAGVTEENNLDSQQTNNIETNQQLEAETTVEESTVEESSEEDKQKALRQRPAENEHIPKLTEKKEPEMVNSSGLEPSKQQGKAKSNMPPYTFKQEKGDPPNEEKKLQYDREFLMKFQFTSEKPKDLPDLEIVLPNPSFQSTKQQMRPPSGFDFTPSFIKPPMQGPNRGGSMHGPRSSRGGSQTKGQQKIISIKTQEVKLHQTDNPYKIALNLKRDKTQLTEDDQTKLMYRKFRSILNKITPQTFDPLVKQAIELTADLTNIHKLEAVMRIIFDKAVDEPAFSVTYAQFCKILVQQNIRAAHEEKEKTFKVALLNCCQKEFESDKEKEAKDLAAKHDALIEEATTEEKKKELMELKEEALTKQRRHVLGNIRFIGELYRLGLLTTKIMHQCIFNLLRKPEEDNLESLCRLLMVVGGQLESFGKENMNTYMQQIQKHATSKHTSSRIRFLIMDVVDMRKAGWQAKQGEVNPMTLEQVHKDAQEEKEQTARAAMQRLSQEKAQRPKNRPTVDEHGFQPVPSRARPERIQIDRAKLPKFSNLGEDAENIQLGPQSKMWGKGATGGGKSSSQEKERTGGGSRYSALASDMGMRSLGRPDRAQPPRQQVKVMQRSSQERERSEALQAARKINDVPPQATVVEKPPQAPSPAPPPVISKAPAVTLSDSDVDRKTKSMLDEYFNNKDLKDAKEYALELRGYYSVFVDKAVAYVIERSSQSRHMTGQIFIELLKSNILTPDDYIQGLGPTVEFAEDMAIDVPKIWDYLGEVISPIVGETVVALSVLKDLLSPLSKSDRAGVVTAKILHEAAHKLGHSPVAEAWEASGLSWTDFLPASCPEQEFIVKEKLEFLQKAHNVPQDVPLSTVADKLAELLKTTKTANEEIFDYISDCVPASKLTSPPFVRMLMTTVCDSVINIQGKMEVNEDKLKTRCLILQRYFDHQTDSEVQALYALQALVHKLQHPPGVLRGFFDVLYDEDVISEESFNAWNNSSDPSEQAGKGIASASVAQFFTWLHTAEPDDQVD